MRRQERRGYRHKSQDEWYHDECDWIAGRYAEQLTP
jgi:hypothetical protein